MILWLVALFVGAATVPHLLGGIIAASSAGVQFYLGGAAFNFITSGIAPLIWWHRRNGETETRVLGFSTQKARGPLLLWVALLVLVALIQNYGAYRESLWGLN